VNQASGVSVRMSIANYETLLANAVRRALRLGEEEAVPRISDLEALHASSCGKLELELAGAERSEAEVIDGLLKRATRRVFDERVPLEGMASVQESFEQGWKVEVSPAMPAREVLAGLDQIASLREAAVALVGSDSPGRVASAVEFILEGLHLSNRLNKRVGERGPLYAKA
jgi:magnesium chelatase subunit I